MYFYKQYVASVIYLTCLFTAPYSSADEYDAKNLITIATGSAPAASDSKIRVVMGQLESVQSSCSATRKGAGFHDKIAKSHSLLNVKQSLLLLLNDFVYVAKLQCANIDDSTLLTLYVLERNSGASHQATIAKLSKNPKQLIAKWSAR